MHLEFMKFYGLKEVPRELTNPTIKGWFSDLGYTYDDSTAWCSCMMNWLAWKLKLERSEALDARSWLNVGINVPLNEAKLGDIVIFWREDLMGWKGHVGLFHGKDDRYIYVGGGNQSDQANTKPYWIDGVKHGFMACRELRTLEEIKKSTNL